MRSNSPPYCAPIRDFDSPARATGYKLNSPFKKGETWAQPFYLGFLGLMCKDQMVCVETNVDEHIDKMIVIVWLETDQNSGKLFGCY